MLIVFIRTILIYITVIFALKIMGKSELSKLSTFQMVILFMIAELASIPIDSPKEPLFLGIAAILTLLFLQVLFSFLSLKFECFKNLINGRPSILIDHGKINAKEMKRLRMTINDLFEELRLSDCPSPSDVEFAIMEANGELSLLSKEENNALPLILICDGAFYEHNLTKGHLSKEKLCAILKGKNLSTKDILVAYLDREKKVHIYPIPKSGDNYSKEVHL